jgi:perosamine synthetase
VAERLALHGGSPVRPRLLPYGRQVVDDDDVAAVVAALRSDFLTTGPRVAEFERAFADRVGARHAVAVSSGTAGLHLAVLAAGIAAGDEVVTTPLTFVATANAALHAGARPVFADIDPDTLNLDPAALERRVTARTRAIVPVHFAGQPCDLEAIHALAGARGLLVVEDAAHALGAEYRGRPVGALSALTVFSLHPVKHVTSGEGGMVTTDDAALAARMRRLRNHGLALEASERQARGVVHAEMVELGFNYRLTDLQSALGRSQLARLDRFLARREAIAARYRAALAGVPGLRVPRVLEGGRHAWHIFPVLVDGPRVRADRDTVVAALRAENIGAAVHYGAVYRHPHYASLGYRAGLCPVAEDVCARILTLPLAAGMTDGDVDDVVTATWKVLEHFAA